MKYLASILILVGLVTIAVRVSAEQPSSSKAVDSTPWPPLDTGGIEQTAFEMANGPIASSPRQRVAGDWVGSPWRYDRNQFFSLNVDALWLKRRNSAPQSIVYSDRDDEVMGMSNFDFSPEVGSQFSLFLHHYCRYALEFRYAQLGLSRGDTVEGRDYRFDRPGGEVIADAFSASYTSDYDSYEVNFRSQTRPWLNLFAGLRIVDLDEGFFIDRAPFGESFFDIYRTQNHLYGAQIGSDLLLWNRDWGKTLEVELNFRAGVYYNRIDFEGDLISAAGRFGGAEDSEDHPAFLSELGVTAIYHLTDRFALRLGYQLMWIEGVAMATDQIQSTNMTTGRAEIQAEDSLLFHGIFAGFSGVY